LLPRHGYAPAPRSGHADRPPAKPAIVPVATAEKVRDAINDGEVDGWSDAMFVTATQAKAVAS
jgi:hypothetical protein